MSDEDSDERSFFLETALTSFEPDFNQEKNTDEPKTSKNKSPDKPKPHYAGHRERLRERFRSMGDEALADYEILELLLFRLLPRRDTKPIAKALLERFKTLSGVIGAPEKLLMDVSGIGESAATDIKIIAAISKRTLLSEIRDREVLSSWSSVIDYCRAAMAHETREQFRILFLDKKNVLIADEVQQIGTVDHTPVYTREVVHRALDLGATAIILLHNHPSGDPTPSRADIEMTRTIADSAKALGIAVHDHIIIGKDGQCSMKGLQLF